MAGHARSSSVDGPPIPKIPLLLHTEQESVLSPLDRRSETYRHIAAEVAGHVAPGPERVRQPLLTLPNILTFMRLIMVPVLVVLWELDWRWSPITAAGVFIAAALTDWLDGYLARRLKLTTVFGAFADPVADKIMVCSALVLLTTSPPHPLKPRHMVLPVCIIIGREITMSALREWAAAAGGAAHKAVKVNSYGKWKTALQMVAMSSLLVLRQGPAGLAHLLPASLASLAAPHVLLAACQVSFLLLWLASALAVWSLSIYMSNVWTHFVYPQAAHAKAH